MRQAVPLGEDWGREREEKGWQKSGKRIIRCANMSWLHVRQQPNLVLWPRYTNQACFHGQDVRRGHRVFSLPSKGALSCIDGQMDRASPHHHGLMPPAASYCFLLVRSSFIKQRSRFSEERRAAGLILKSFFLTGVEKSNLQDNAHTGNKL